MAKLTRADPLATLRAALQRQLILNRAVRSLSPVKR